MNNKTKLTRRIFFLLLLIIILGFSNYLLRFAMIDSSELLSLQNVFVYLGLLLGFAITIYTFGTSMLLDIFSKLDTCSKLEDKDVKEIKGKLNSGFQEIKSDIMCIFVLVIVIVCFDVLRYIECPFDIDVESFMIPETVFLSSFIVSTAAIYDIIKSVFNISEIGIFLNKKH